MKNFKQLLIWRKGIDIAVKTIKFSQTLPDIEKFGLRTQMNNAAYSIPSNIAEGSSRKSERDYHRFIEISLGSSFELETHVLIAESVNYGDPDLRSQLLLDVDSEQKMLISFMNKLIK